MKSYVCPKCDHRTPSLTAYELHMRGHEPIPLSLAEVDDEIARFFADGAE